jgi:hypothetical protein
MKAGQVARLVIVASFCLLCVSAGQKAELQQLYIVEEGVSDAAPFWSTSIVHVLPEGGETIVRRIRIRPLDGVCASVVTVAAAEARLAGSPDHVVARAAEPCAISQREIDRAVGRGSRYGSIDDAVQYGIVARCGSADRVLHLPFDQQIEPDRLRRKHPRVAALWQLHSRLLHSVPPLAGLSDSENLDTQRRGESLVPLLISGAFNRGFSACRSQPEQRCRPAAIRQLVDGSYLGRVPRPVREGRLLVPPRDQFFEYSPPAYPPLALQARIQGTVELYLTIEGATGLVSEAHVIGGHPLLVAGSVASARNWHVGAELRRAKRVRAILEYSLRCP